MNARAAIGGDGVKIGWVKYDACEDCTDEMVKRSADSDTL